MVSFAYVPVLAAWCGPRSRTPEGGGRFPGCRERVRRWTRFALEVVLRPRQPGDLPHGARADDASAATRRGLGAGGGSVGAARRVLGPAVDRGRARPVLPARAGRRAPGPVGSAGLRAAARRERPVGVVPPGLGTHASGHRRARSSCGWRPCISFRPCCSGTTFAPCRQMRPTTRTRGTGCSCCPAARHAWWSWASRRWPPSPSPWRGTAGPTSPCEGW